MISISLPMDAFAEGNVWIELVAWIGLGRENKGKVRLA